MGCANPFDDRVAVCGVLRRDGTAGHQQHIRIRHIGERRINAQVHQVVVVVDQAGALSADDHFRAGQIGEYLVGADCVESGESLVKAGAMIILWSPFTARMAYLFDLATCRTTWPQNGRNVRSGKGSA